MGDEWAGANVGSPHLLSPRRVQCVGQYDLGKTIGSGQFGKVKLATHVLTKAKVAVKIINKTKLEPDTLVMVYREISIMKLLHHPNIIRLYEVVDTEKVLFLIMEYASGGEVLDFIVAHGRLGEKEARRFFRQILSAIAYCHKVHVVHRDLKCENLLLDKSLNIKIIDFGLSNHFTPGVMLKTFCGSPTYAAPELILKREYAGPEVDIWSMGVMLYVLVCGKLPFEGHDFLSLFTRILHADYKLPDFVSPDLASLLRSILVVDPKRRATLHQIMAHPWVTAGEDIAMLYEPESPALTEAGLDEEVLMTMETTLHFDRKATAQSVLGNKYDDAAATYLLLVERKQKERENDRDLRLSDKDALTPPSASGPTPSPPPPETKQPVVPAQSAEHKKGKGHRRTRTVEGHIHLEHNKDTITKPPVDPPSARPRPKHVPSPLRDSPSVDMVRSSAPNTAANTGAPRVHISPPHVHLQAGQDPPDLTLPLSPARTLSTSNPANPNPNYNPASRDSGGHSSNSNSTPVPAPSTSPSIARPPSLPATPRDDSVKHEPLLSPNRIEKGSSGEPGVPLTHPPESYTHITPPPKRRGHQRHVSVDVGVPKKESKESGGLLESVLGFKSSSRRSSGKNHNLIPSPTPTPAPSSTPPMPPHSMHHVAPAVSPTSGGKKNKTPVPKLDVAPAARPITLVDSFKQSLGFSKREKEEPRKPADEPRSGRFAFNTSTTSEKDPLVIIADIKELLKSMNIVYSETGAYAVDCWAGDIRFEIEVCKLPRLSYSGLKMKRIAGDVWNYKAVVDKLVQRLNLSDYSAKGGSGIARP